MIRREIPAARVWVILGLFTALVAFAGGASRYDAIQIVALRALAPLFLIPIYLYLSSEKLKADIGLVIMLGCFISIAAVQLVPLPPGLWHNLPGREGIAELDGALGLSDQWRPLTFTPMRSWNVLGSLIVPSVGLLLAIAIGASSLMLLRVIAGLGVLNAFLGLIQVASGKLNLFYIYELTNKGSPVGIFANENHSAIFAACAMLIVMTLGLEARNRKAPAWENLLYVPAFFLILLVALSGASRSGLAAALGALLVSGTMLVLAPRIRRPGGRRPGDRFAALRARIVWVIPVVIAVITAGAFIGLDRAPAFEDLLRKNAIEDLRWELWPPILEMLKDHWIFGSGFGSFEQVYHIYEPSALLMPNYINQAHNDWAQVVIEGGVFAAVVLVALLVWIVKAIVLLTVRGAPRPRIVFWISVFSLVALASTIDYPLRTPLFQLIGIWLLLALARDVRDTSDMKAT